LFEATNGRNWGKFLVGVMDVEWAWRSQVDDSPAEPSVLLNRLGWARHHLWVMDLATGEGALFAPGGYAKGDLDHHRIWVCPLFEPFLAWLYTQDITRLADLPQVVEVDAPFALTGYRRPGHGEPVWDRMVPMVWLAFIGVEHRELHLPLLDTVTERNIGINDYDAILRVWWELQPDQWVEREPIGPVDGGDVGGDVQLGTAWERSWITRTPGEPGQWSVLTSSYYVAADADGAGTGERYVQHQLDWLVCTRPGDPGGTEVWSELNFDQLADDRQITDELARGFSERDAADPTDGYGWDGRPVCTPDLYATPHSQPSPVPRTEP
jgi:hypothetical protein